MNKLIEDVIVKPKPFRDFACENVIYIPCDSSSRILQRIIKKASLKEKNTGFGYLYLLENKIVLFQSIGAPSAVLALEPLILSGAKKITLLGFCGSLNSRYRIMNVAIISKAFSEEGTSRHYFSRKRIFHPSLILKKRIKSILQESKIPWIEGSLVSTDAPYRETKSWLKEKQKKGIDLVDMEVSAVFALAKFYNIHAAALLIVTDELWKGEWRRGFHSIQMKERIKKYFSPFI